MGYALTPVFFYDISTEIGVVDAASREEFLRFGQRRMTLAEIGPGKLEEYDDGPGHFLYTFTDGEWFEFHEAT